MRLFACVIGLVSHFAHLSHLCGLGVLCRYRDDAELDDHLRSVLRDGDPMADLLREKAERKARKAAKKLAKLVSEGKADPTTAASSLAVLKPAYKGSAPANRFGIRPGYRWDGVDRSNGWEVKVLAAIRSAPFSR